MNTLGIDLILYADDATCLSRSKKLEDAITTESSSALDKLPEWFKANKLKMNKGKTKFMVFTTRPVSKKWSA